MVWSPLTINLGIMASLVGFVALGLLAVGDRRNGNVGILGLVLLAVGIVLALGAAVTMQLN